MDLYKLLSNDEQKMINEAHSQFYNKFTRNGWKWLHNDKEHDYDNLCCYSQTILSDNYECTIFAIVSDSISGMDTNGKMGILWLEVEYEYKDRPYSITDLKDMIAGIKYAEQNLVTLGIPFCDNYKFNQNTVDENKTMIERNAFNYKTLKLDKIEQIVEDACSRITI